MTKFVNFFGAPPAEVYQFPKTPISAISAIFRGPPISIPPPLLLVGFKMVRLCFAIAETDDGYVSEWCHGVQHKWGDVANPAWKLEKGAGWVEGAVWTPLPSGGGPGDGSGWLPGLASQFPKTQNQIKKRPQIQLVLNL